MHRIGGQIWKVDDINKKSVGEIADPWGTPALVWKEEDDIPSTTTLRLRSERKLSNYLQSFGARPKEVSLARRFLCHTISKAFEMSKATARVSFLDSRVLFQIWVTYARMSPVDRCRLKPYCLSWINLFDSKCGRTCSLMAFSIILDRTEVIVKGR